MSLSRCRESVASGAVVILRAGALGLALVAAGCASSHGARETAAQAHAQGRHGHGAEGTDVEDDGLPTQAPPLHRRSAEPDDPTQPYSRSYGTVPPRKSAEAGRAPASATAAPPAGLGRFASRRVD